MSDLASRLLSAIQERKTLAEAAAKAKPGEWKAHTTHNGFEWTGWSHVRAEEATDDRRTSRPVAYQIADQLELVRSGFAEAPPSPAVVAQHIAANSPAVVLRQVERDERVLLRHTPYFDDETRCSTCSGCGQFEPCDDKIDLAHAYAIPTEETQ